MEPSTPLSLPTPLSPLDTVKAIYDAFARRDIAAVLALYSPEIRILQSAELPWGGEYHGHEGAGRFFGKLTSALNSTLELERYIRAGDDVVAIGWTSGVAKATGASYRVPIAHVWTIRDGRAIEARFMIDNPTMLSALALGGA